MSKNMAKGFKIIIFYVLLMANMAFGQEKPLLLKHATLYLGNGENLENASIILENGVLQIKEGDYAIIEDNYRVIDGSGLHVYPFETLSKTESKAFVTEFENLISLHSASDSTLTARVFHNQLPENYFLNKEAITNLVVLSREWEYKRGRKIRFVIYRGELMHRVF
jgi:hypothetical protein